MNKKLFILFLFFKLNVSAQVVLVLDESFNMPVGGVLVYSNSKPDTLYTSNIGEVDLLVFDDEDEIVFEHELFGMVSYKKIEAVKKKEIKLSRGDVLQEENKSSLTVEEYSKDLPFYVDIIDLKENSIFQSSSEDIGVSQKVMYEKNQSGGTTVFRGLEVNKVLLVMDGVRLDNTIYRYGRIQNSINFEGSIIERSQQIYGTSFLIYSCDATGGVIHYLTRQPEFSKDNAVKINLDATSQYATATDTWNGNVNLKIGFNKIATYTGFTYSNYGNIKVGKNRPDFITSNYGLQKYNVQTINNIDSMVENYDSTLLTNTDYTQYSFVNKIAYSKNENLLITSNINYSKTSDVGIYSGLAEVNGANNRFAVCKLAPQDNFLSSFNILLKKTTFFYSYFSILGSYQYIEEYRITRKFNNPRELHQIENLDVYSVNFDFIKLVKIHRLMYGLEYSNNKLISNAFFRNIFTDSTSVGLTRYPTGGTKMNSFAGYVNFKWLIHPQFIVNVGVRYEYVLSESKFSNQSPQLQLGFDKIRFNNGAPSASLSFDAYPFSGFLLTLIASSAYHIPIADEYGKVMTKDFVVVIPNNNLKSEKSYNLEISATQTILESVRLNVTAFNTWLKDAIILTPYLLNGNDSLYFGTDKYIIATKSNISMAQIYGISASISTGFYFNDEEDEYLKLKFSINYIEGKNLQENVAYPNISPLFGQSSATFQYHNFGTSISHVFNGLKEYDDLSPIGEDYIEKADKIGFMPWQTLSIRGSYIFLEHFSIQLSVNNIFDAFFRTYASAISAPGRNFIITLKIDY